MNEMMEQEDWDKPLRSKDIEANWTKYKENIKKPLNVSSLTKWPKRVND